MLNSCERLLSRTLILDVRNIGILDLSFGYLSDLIHGITENGLRHVSGPVHLTIPSVTCIYASVDIWVNSPCTFILCHSFLGYFYKTYFCVIKATWCQPKNNSEFLKLFIDCILFETIYKFQNLNKHWMIYFKMISQNKIWKLPVYFEIVVGFFSSFLSVFSVNLLIVSSNESHRIIPI